MDMKNIWLQQDIGLTITARGRAERTDGADLEGCRPHCTSGSTTNSQWCQMFFFLSRVQLLIHPSSVSSPHHFVHFFYLFKADIYGLYQAWKGKQLTEMMGFYFTAVILYSWDLFSVCLSFLFFFEQIKSFSIPNSCLHFEFQTPELKGENWKRTNL